MVKSLFFFIIFYLPALSSDMTEILKRAKDFHPRVYQVEIFIGHSQRVCTTIRAIDAKGNPEELKNNTTYFAKPDTTQLNPLDLENKDYMIKVLERVSIIPTYNMHNAEPTREEETPQDFQEPEIRRTFGTKIQSAK